MGWQGVYSRGGAGASLAMGGEWREGARRGLVWGGVGGSAKWTSETVPGPCPIRAGSSPCPWSDFPVPQRVLRTASGPGCEEGTSLGAVSVFPLLPGKEGSYSKHFLPRCSEGELAREAVCTGHGGWREGQAAGVLTGLGVELGAGVSGQRVCRDI